MLIYFLCDNCNPPLKKVTPLFPSNPHLKVEVLSSPPLLKISVEAQPPCRKGGGCTLWITVCLKSIVTSNLQEWHQNMQNCKSLFSQVFFVYIHSQWEQKLKTFQERPDFVCGRFIKVFYKANKGVL